MNTVRGMSVALIVAMLGLAGPAMASPVDVTHGFVYAADPGQGLDLQGNFAYALNFTNEATDYTVLDAVFKHYSPTTTVAGVTTNIQNVFNYETNGYGVNKAAHSGAPEYAAANAALNMIMNTGGTPDDFVHYAGHNPVVIDLAVTPGQTYKLQLIQHEPYWSIQSGGYDKFASVTLSGAAEGTSPAFGICAGGPGTETQYSNVVTAEFTATTDNLHISWLNTNINDPSTGDWSRLSGLTLEQVPEPATMSLLGLGALALLRRRR